MSYALIFLNEVLFSVFELQKVYLNQDETEKQPWKVWNLAGKLDGNF